MIHESLALPAYSGAMLNLIPQSTPEPRPLAYAEAVSRLASVRHALRLVSPGPEPDCDDAAIAGAWDEAGEARQRCYDTRSVRLIGATAAGVEAMLVEREDGRGPHAAASQALVDQIRRELRDVAGIVLG
jgi:hypothetical protein